MKIEMQELGPCAKRLDIEVGSDNVKKELDQAYRELAKKVSIRGFRKGKVPRPVLERYHRSSVEEEVLQKLIPSSFEQAVKDQGLRAVGQPKLDDIKLDAEKVLRFTATVEVLPEIPLQTYGGWELTRDVRTITEADVERELAELQNRHVELIAVDEDRPIREGDFVLMDFEGFHDGQPVQGVKAESYGLVVGGKTVLENVEHGLVGMHKGESRQIPVQFPDTHDNKSLAGRDVTFHVTVNEIKERVLPELDDEFAKEAGGAETLDELKGKLRNGLEEATAREARRALHNLVVARLIEGNPFELPPGMVAEEVQAHYADLRRHFAPRGSDASPPPLTEELRQQLQEQAVTRIKRELLIEEIAKRDGLTAGDADVEEELKRVAERTEQRIEYIRRQMEQSGGLESLRRGLLADKVLDFVVGRCTVTDVVKPEQGIAPTTTPET
jgi:trigger factor